jgi:hypothetical protein
VGAVKTSADMHPDDAPGTDDAAARKQKRAVLAAGVVALSAAVSRIAAGVSHVAVSRVAAAVNRLTDDP